MQLRGHTIVELDPQNYYLFGGVYDLTTPYPRECYHHVLGSGSWRNIAPLPGLGKGYMNGARIQAGGRIVIFCLRQYGERSRNDELLLCCCVVLLGDQKIEKDTSISW